MKKTMVFVVMMLQMGTPFLSASNEGCFDTDINIDQKQIKEGEDLNVGIGFSRNGQCKAKANSHYRYDISNYKPYIDSYSLDYDQSQIDIDEDYVEFANDVDEAYVEAKVRFDVDEDCKFKYMHGDDERELEVISSRTNTTALQADVEFATVNSVVNYTYTLNEKEKAINSSVSKLAIPEEMAYVSGSFYVTDMEGHDATNLFTFCELANGSFKVTNNNPFNQVYQFHYQVKYNQRLDEYPSIMENVSDNVSENAINYVYDREEEKVTKTTKLTINTVDEKGSPIAGSSFEIKDANGDVVSSGTSAKDGSFQTKALTAGTYTISQKTVGKQYVPLTKPVSVTIDGSSSNEEVKITNELIEGTLVVKNTDQYDNPIANNQFTVVSESGEMNLSNQTDSEGQAEFANLPYGSYTLLNSSDSSYEHDFKVSNDNQRVNVNVTDEQLYGTIEIRRTDANGFGIGGVIYTIYDEDGNEVETLVTDEDGYASSSSLPAGNYYVQETKPAPGMEPDDSIYNFIIDGSDTLVKYEFSDKEKEESKTNDKTTANKQNDSKQVANDDNSAVNAAYQTDNNSAIIGQDTETLNNNSSDNSIVSALANTGKAVIIPFIVIGLVIIVAIKVWLKRHAPSHK